MAREYARVRIDLWVHDDDFRRLSPAAQHLYFVLLTSPSLSYCGVTDWRPGRLAAFAGGWTAEDVRAAADELSRQLYVVVDEETEEVLIRTFVRHDGLMKESRVAVSMVKAFAAVASNTIRGVIVHELHRLHEEDPTLKGWLRTNGEPGEALRLLDLTPIDPSTLGVGLGVGLPDGLGVGLAQTSTNVWGSVSGSTSPAPTPAPSPSTSNEVENDSAPRKRGRRIPDDFAVTDAMRQWATDNDFGHLDLDQLTDEFRDYWAAESGAKASKLDWTKTWQNRVREIAKRAATRGNGGGTYPTAPDTRPGPMTGEQIKAARAAEWQRTQQMLAQLDAKADRR